MASGAGSRPSCRCGTALENSLKDQTYNTPAVATLFLLAEEVRWMLDGGGLDWCVARAREPPPSTCTAGPSAARTRPRSSTTPRSARSSWARSTSTSDVDAAAVAATLRANGIVDVEPYRKLGRNQLRVGMFPAVETADVQALTACIDWIVERIASMSATAANGDGPDADGERPKVLVKEQIGDSGVELLREHFDVDIGIDWTDEKLAERIGAYEGIVIRSATKMTGELIAAREQACA